MSDRTANDRRGVFTSGFLSTTPEVEIENIPVTGRLPEWLQGTLLRNGPGQVQVGAQTMRHWFDGFAMLNKFSIHDGRVDYAGKYLETRVRRAAVESGQISYTEFATDPCRSLFERAMVVFNHSVGDNAKVSLTRFAERFIALCETPIQVEFDAETLKSVGVFSYEDNPVGQMTTAHPHFEGDSMFNVVTRFGASSHYNAYRVARDMSKTKIGSVKAGKPAYMHSFGMTQNYIIVTEFPLVVNPLGLLFWLRPFIENFGWEPRRGTPFYVINRHTGEFVGRYACDPFFAFHHVNGYERGDELILDIVAYPNADIVTDYYLNRLSAPDLSLPHGKLTRFVVPLHGKRVRSDVLSDTCIELPHFDYAGYNMKPDYRSVYGIGLRPDRPNEFYNQLVKVDVTNGATRTWHEDDCFPGEPVFVPSPQRHAEDDGVLLSLVLDAAADRSYLLVLDAQTLGEVARATLPHPLMIGYHGIFVPSADR